MLHEIGHCVIPTDKKAPPDIQQNIKQITQKFKKMNVK